MTGVQTCALPICFPVTIHRQIKEKAYSAVCYYNLYNRKAIAIPITTVDLCTDTTDSGNYKVNQFKHKNKVSKFDYVQYCIIQKYLNEAERFKDTEVYILDIDNNQLIKVRQNTDIDTILADITYYTLSDRLKGFKILEDNPDPTNLLAETTARMCSLLDLDTPTYQVLEETTYKQHTYLRQRYYKSEQDIPALKETIKYYLKNDIFDQDQLQDAFRQVVLEFLDQEGILETVPHLYCEYHKLTPIAKDFRDIPKQNLVTQHHTPTLSTIDKTIINVLPISNIATSATPYQIITQLQSKYTKFKILGTDKYFQENVS